MYQCFGHLVYNLHLKILSTVLNMLTTLTHLITSHLSGFLKLQLEPVKVHHQLFHHCSLVRFHCSPFGITYRHDNGTTLTIVQLSGVKAADNNGGFVFISTLARHSKNRNGYEKLLVDMVLDNHWQTTLQPYQPITADGHNRAFESVSFSVLHIAVVCPHHCQGWSFILPIVCDKWCWLTQIDLCTSLRWWIVEIRRGASVQIICQIPWS